MIRDYFTGTLFQLWNLSALHYSTFHYFISNTLHFPERDFYPRPALVAQKHFFLYKHIHCLQRQHKKIFWYSYAFKFKMIFHGFESMLFTLQSKISILSLSFQWDFQFFPIHLNDDKQIFYLSFPCVKNKLWSDEGLAESDQLSTCIVIQNMVIQDCQGWVFKSWTISSVVTLYDY